MNIILLRQNDFCINDNNVSITDHRFDHIQTVLKSKVGDKLKVGIIGGNRGYGTIKKIESDKVVMDVFLNKEPLSRHNFDIVLSLPRPKMLRRILRTIAEFGVHRLHIVNSARVEKSYWQSPLLKNEKIQDALQTGMERSGDTIMTDVMLYKRFRPFVEDILPKLCAHRECYLTDINSQKSIKDLKSQDAVIIIGPEGGFVPFEIDLTTSVIANKINLGNRILSVDTALTTVLAQALT